MKTTIIAAVLALSPAIGFAMGCSYGKHETAMSCADGMAYDSEKGACAPIASS